MRRRDVRRLHGDRRLRLVPDERGVPARHRRRADDRLVWILGVAAAGVQRRVASRVQRRELRRLHAHDGVRLVRDDRHVRRGHVEWRDGGRVRRVALARVGVHGADELRVGDVRRVHGDARLRLVRVERRVRARL